MPFPLGAIFAGDPVGRYQETSQKGMKAMQEQLDEQSAALFGKSLQELFQSATPGATAMPQVAQGVPGVGGQGQQPTAPKPAAVSQPPASGAAPAVTPAPAGGRGGNAFGPGEQPMPTGGPPPGSVGSQEQQGGGGQQPQATGPLTLQQVVQSVIKSAGPKADPQVIAGAVQRYLPLMNAQSQQQAREMLNYFKEQNLNIRDQEMRDREAQNRRENERKDAAAAESKRRWDTGEARRQEAAKLSVQRFQESKNSKDLGAMQTEISNINRIITQRDNEAFNLSIPFNPKDRQELVTLRDELQRQYDALATQMKGGGGASPADQSTKGDQPPRLRPYPPPQ